MKGFKVCAAAAVLMTFAACSSSGGGSGGGGGGGQTTETPDQVSDLQAYQDLQDSLLERSNARFDAIPTQGTAEYNGFAYLQIFSQPENATFSGEARVNVDFETDAMTGRVRNLSGTDRFGEDVDVTGALQLRGTVGAERPNQIGGTVRGTLDAGGQDLIVQGGDLDLDFRGTPVRGLLGGAQLPTVIYGGAGYSGLMGIAVE